MKRFLMAVAAFSVILAAVYAKGKNKADEFVHVDCGSITLSDYYGNL